MVTVLVLGSALLVATALGWGAHRLGRRLRSRRLRIALSASVAVASLLFAFLLFNRQRLTLPATDSAIFGDRASYAVEIYLGDRAGTTPDATAALTLPRAVRLRDEAAVDLLLRREAVPPHSDAYVALLQAGRGVEGRTTNPCAGAAPDTGPTSVRACASPGVSGEAPFRWMVRSEAPGTTYVSVQLPPQVSTQMEGDRGRWSARVRRDGHIVTRIVGFEERPSAVRQVPLPLSARRPIEDAVVLSAANPVFRDRDTIEIDLRSGQFTFPLRFETTLGVSARTYEVLTLVGGLASAVLGGGWLWQLLSWLRQRQQHPPKPPLVIT